MVCACSCSHLVVTAGSQVPWTQSPGCRRTTPGVLQDCRCLRWWGPTSGRPQCSITSPDQWFKEQQLCRIHWF